MTLLGQFALWVAFLVGLWCVAIALAGRWRDQPALAAKTSADSSFYDVGLKMGAKVVPGSVRRDPANRQIDFQVSDGLRTYPVTYRGLVPDTFTDANDIEVIVEGRLGRDGVFRATEVLAKCGSRYEAVAEGKQA